jgi:16S rRNA (cytosine967-C5)-methyltransferase
LSDQKPREIAARILQRRTRSGDYVENLLEKELARANLSNVDRRLCQELAYGVVRWQATLDWLIARKTAPRAQKPALQSLLQLGLYQIFWLDRIPDHAAVNETVEQARRSGFGPQAGFVNAILRGYLREFDATRQALTDLKSTQPHLGHSHPEWLVQRWQQRWGTDRASQLMDWNNTTPITYARVNSLRFNQPLDPHGERKTLKDAGDVLSRWRDEDVEYDFVRRDWLDENLVFELKAHPPLTRLWSFKQGLFYVQDPSTLLAPAELDPQPGETVLDLCAAPGGKATYIAQQLKNDGRLVAHDTSPERTQLIEENFARLGVTCGKAASTLDNLPQSFDRVLVDAPCSNTGVMRRRVDLRWRIRPEEIQRLQSTQAELLARAAKFVKPRGTLVYSTCSLEREENQDVVGRFTAEHPDFRLEIERELLPITDRVDGAYVAGLVRV